MEDTAPTGPAGSDASRHVARDPEQRTRRRERRVSISRTMDDARTIEAEGRADEMRQAAARQGLDSAVGAVERLSKQVVADAEIIGAQRAEIQRLETELGSYRKGEKKDKRKVKIARVEAETDLLKTREWASLWNRLGPTVLPAVLPELLPLLRPLLRRGEAIVDKLLPEVAAVAAGGDGATPRAAAMRLFARLYPGTVPEGADEDAREVAELGDRTREFLQVLAGVEDWPLVQEFLVSMAAAPTPAPAPATH